MLKIRWIIACAGALAAIFLFFVPGISTAADECGAPPAAGGPILKAKLVPMLVNSSAPTGLTPIIAFGDQRDQRSALLEYRAEGCEFSAADVGKTIGIETVAPRDSDGRPFNPMKLGAGGSIKSREIVAIDLLVQPDTEASPPGTYTTGLAISDDRIELTRQPVLITMRYESKYLLLVMVLLPVAIGGSIAVWYKGRAAGSKESYWQWLKRFGNLIAIAAGTGAFIAYMQNSVLSVPDYGRYLYDASVLEWLLEPQFWLLVAAAGAAFTTAALALSIAGDAARGGTNPTQEGEGGKLR
jgi:hypothetical protein